MPIYTSRTRPVIYVRRNGKHANWLIEVFIEGDGSVPAVGEPKPRVRVFAWTRGGAVRRGVRAARRLEPLDVRVES